MQKKLTLRTQRRVNRVRNSLKSRELKPRVVVFRSLKHVYAQIVDDAQQRTLLALSTQNLKDLSGDKSAVARLVGQELGKKAIEKSIEDVFFDRGRYKYHGRIKALADGLRESGLKF